MSAAVLQDRRLVRVAGVGARAFLQGLVTCDMDKVSEAAAAYGALLSPQGKILFDFFVALKADEEFWLDVPAALAADFIKRLGFYRLRAKIVIEAVNLEVMSVWVRWNGATAPAGALMSFADPRDAGLGMRNYMNAASHENRAAYDAHRIKLGVPEGGADFAYGETFPHEANLDRLNGVDFNKGCYVGQEVVSRVEHRGTARKRIVRVTFEGEAPARGAAVLAGDLALGVMGSSSAAGMGLAMLRLDKVEEALAKGIVLHAGAVAVHVKDQMSE